MDLAYELHDLVLTLDRWAEASLRPHGLSYNRYLALVIIAEHPGLTGRRLAEPLRVSEAAVSGIVRSLLAAGLVEDASSPGSGYVRRLRVSPAGSELLARCSGLLGSALDDSARAVGLDPRELAKTIRALHDHVRSAGDDTATQDPKRH
ncbi:MAG: MarR family transcriptional regulator [Pseudoclavibacter sp.]|nr:MarR family transcriptional regulator [Pseudoclavibacter sp.]